MISGKGRDVGGGIVVYDDFKSPVKKRGDKLVVKVRERLSQSPHTGLLCTDCQHTARSHALIGRGTCDGDGVECACVRFRFPPKP